MIRILVNIPVSLSKHCHWTPQHRMEEDTRKKKKEEIIQVAADTLKELTVVLKQQQNDHYASRRSASTTSKEAHPRSVHSVHSTKPPHDPAPSSRAPEPNSSSSISSSSSPQVIDIVSASCKVSRQISSPVDLPSPSAKSPTCSPKSPTCSASLEQRLEAYLVIEHHTAVIRPEGLPLRREASSSSPVATPCQEASIICSCVVASAAEQMVSSYPPGPTVTRVQACSCSARQPIASVSV